MRHVRDLSVFHQLGLAWTSGKSPRCDTGFSATVNHPHTSTATNYEAAEPSYLCPPLALESLALQTVSPRAGGRTRGGRIPSRAPGPPQRIGKAAPRRAGGRALGPAKNQTPKRALRPGRHPQWSYRQVVSSASTSYFMRTCCRMTFSLKENLSG